MKKTLLSTIAAVMCATWIPLALGAPDAKQSLNNWWRQYQQRFIEKDGRVTRPREKGDTVSEGQAYAMLFAVLLDDRETFNRVHEWTEAHLSRAKEKGDHLLAQRWEGGAVADWNPVSDADLDYALALLLGHRRWSDAALQAEALLVAADVLAKEAHTAPKVGLVLGAGLWADGTQTQAKMEINLSCASPAAFRLLAAAGGDKRWTELIASTYKLWDDSGKDMGMEMGAGLPPDWCLLVNGKIEKSEKKPNTYGREALRVPMQAGLDALLFPDEKAGAEYLRQRPITFFRNWFANKPDRQNVVAVYKYDGRASDPAESLAMTATALFAFQAAGETPLMSLEVALDRQLPDKKFADDYFSQSMAFFPLAFRADLFKADWLKKN